MKINRLTLLLLSVAVFVVSCFKQQNEKLPTEIDFSKLPYKTLSEYGFFKGKMNELLENEGVVPYEPIASLFTDYAFKKRFVWVPKNSYATVNDKDTDAPIEFPEHTVLIKNFYYPADFNKPTGDKKIIETRVLVKLNGIWEAFPYKWNDNQTDADLKITGASLPVSYINENHQQTTIKYAIPNKNQCKSCHHRNNMFSPIGPKVKQLNHAIAYADGNENQLKKWVQLGILKMDKSIENFPNLVNPYDTKNELSQRARSYLDVNCGHCHSQNGPASTSGLYLNVEENRPFHLGVMKSPVAAGIGAGTFKYDIYPKKGDESIMVFRMNSVHPGIMMPELGRVSIHKEGVELIKNWINTL